MKISQILRHLPANGVKGLPNIKNVIAVGSGKGGVGKSTVALNLALALQAQGANVGLLDADIYGPSLPHMINKHERAAINEDKTIEPIRAFGLQVMSLGFLITKDTPAVWRGPMASGALQQMLTSTKWRDLDYLIIDLPPGTGDVQLTLAQKIPVCGAVVVTTPQDVALIDVEKAIAMFAKVKIPVFGIVENMSVHICSNCGQHDHIFGAHGGVNLAAQHRLKLLGALPLQRNIRELADSGMPAFNQDSAIAAIFTEIAQQVTKELAKMPRDYAVPITNMVIEEN